MSYVVRNASHLSYEWSAPARRLKTKGVGGHRLAVVTYPREQRGRRARNETNTPMKRPRAKDTTIERSVGGLAGAAFVALGLAGASCAAFDGAKVDAKTDRPGAVSTRDDGQGVTAGSGGYSASGDAGANGTTFRSPDTVPSAPAHLALGETFSCAWRDGGEARCWGANDQGQLGRGKAGAEAGAGSALVMQSETVALTGIKQLGLGRRHACALLLDGSVRCWGRNGAGELGIGAVSDEPVALPKRVMVNETDTLEGVESIALGDNHACARLADATVRCWGFNSSGQLGRGTESSPGRSFAEPVFVNRGERLDGVTQLLLGPKRSCAERGPGEFWCWGDNAFGELSATSPPGEPGLFAAPLETF
jgi:Regulator of Chromosome Condensation (RCC1) repeat protein